jgi:hypothetical protein
VGDFLGSGDPAKPFNDVKFYDILHWISPD